MRLAVITIVLLAAPTGLWAQADHSGHSAPAPASDEPHLYEGAGHGFLRAQDDREGANLKATRQAWPRTASFLRELLK
jgi:dienelactone hydrolase